MRGLPNVTYCTLTRQSSGNWGRHVKQHAFLYQLWTTGALLNILLGPSNHDSQNSPNETHELGSWVKKWDDVPWVWTMGFDAFLCEYEFFWILKEIFPKSMIILTWCGSPMKWSHVVWKICPQHCSKQTLTLLVILTGHVLAHDLGTLVTPTSYHLIMYVIIATKFTVNPYPILIYMPSLYYLVPPILKRITFGAE